MKSPECGRQPQAVGPWVGRAGPRHHRRTELVTPVKAEQPRFPRCGDGCSLNVTAPAGRLHLSAPVYVCSVLVTKATSRVWLQPQSPAPSPPAKVLSRGTWDPSPRLSFSFCKMGRIGPPSGCWESQGVMPGNCSELWSVVVPAESRRW